MDQCKTSRENQRYTRPTLTFSQTFEKMNQIKKPLEYRQFSIIFGLKSESPTDYHTIFSDIGYEANARKSLFLMRGGGHQGERYPAN